jgi:hypothetical protein
MHGPLFPSWSCEDCSQPWPCDLKRESLLEEFDGARLALVLYMAGLFVEAAADLPDERVGSLHDRFLGWARKGLTG